MGTAEHIEPTAQRRGRLPRWGYAAFGALVVLALAAVGLLALGGGGSQSRTHAVGSKAAAAKALSPEEKAALADHSGKALKAHPHVVQVGGAGSDNGITAEDQVAGISTGANAPHAPTDAEIRSELAAFKRHLAGGGGLRHGPVAQVLSTGEAVAPIDAPPIVDTIIRAGNAIAKTPYKWGGGHGAWSDTGYDCSGSVSFALAAAGLLNSPLDSTGLSQWGAPGEGKWVTIYANGGHAFMVVAGLRFDTSGRSGPTGTRWQPAMRSTGGFVARHPPGL
jgi:cell wall-associated NlpC family hydrolase